MEIWNTGLRYAIMRHTIMALLCTLSTSIIIPPVWDYPDTGGMSHKLHKGLQTSYLISLSLNFLVG